MKREGKMKGDRGIDERGYWERLKGSEGNMEEDRGKNERG